MATDQQRVIDVLADPRTHGGMPVERIETHSAIVFLAGRRALKMKRAVKFDYLDFSTLDLRRQSCEAEVRINSRAAPTIYRGVAAVTRESDGRLILDGRGEPVEWLVDMARFDQEALLDRLAERNTLDLALMPRLGEAVADFHRGAAVRTDHGGYAGMAWVLRGNDEGFAQQGVGILDPRICRDLSERSRRELERHAALLDERRAAGRVRQCHGDLHLRNIVLLDGRPTLFDAIEFNDEIACADVWYDTAFLLMDLWRRRLPRHANALFNSYVAHTDDLAGLALLPFFLSCRAAVRAKTGATAARLQSDPVRSRELREAAREYLSMAITLLQPAPPHLVAVGGFSGSGKSTIARALAPTVGAVPGALVLRSDEIRKAICGSDPLHHLGPEGYSRDVTVRVYRTIADRAAEALAAGHAVIADAVYARPEDRAAIEAVAVAAHVPFNGVWLDAPHDVLLARVGRRAGDASDADAAVVQQQLTQGAGTVAWRLVDANRDEAAVLEDARPDAQAVGSAGDTCIATRMPASGF
jgi:aminoglycoside phosphotransferase family enzyme/predicted kinase